MGSFLKYQMGVSALAGYLFVRTAQNLSDYCITKSAVLQEQLSRSPELSDVVIKGAENMANICTRGEMTQALIYGTLSATAMGMVLYTTIHDKPK